VNGGYQGQLNSFATPWFGVSNGTRYCVWWAAYAQGGYGGAVTANYEYQLFEGSVVAPSWVPLRFPGQYSDAESQLFENWNRVYDPAAGIYFAPDPVLPSPLDDPRRYAYASGNPLALFDETGSVVQTSTNEQGYFIQQLLRRPDLGKPIIGMIFSEKIFRFLEGKPADYRGEWAGGAVRPAYVDGDGKVVVEVYNDYSGYQQYAQKNGFDPSPAIGLFAHELAHAYVANILGDGRYFPASLESGQTVTTSQGLAVEWENRFREGQNPRPQFGGFWGEEVHAVPFSACRGVYERLVSRVGRCW
jgi:RHS repeat-associated protein